MKEFGFLLDILEFVVKLGSTTKGFDTLEFIAKNGTNDFGLSGWLLMIIFTIGFFIKLDSAMAKQPTQPTRKLEPSGFPQYNKSKDRDSR